MYSHIASSNVRKREIAAVRVKLPVPSVKLPPF